MLLYYLMIGVAVRFGLDMAWMWLVVGGALILAGCACMVRLPRWVRWIWRAGLCAGIALVIALSITAIIIIFSGKSPVVAFASMYKGAFGNINSIRAGALGISALF